MVQGLGSHLGLLSLRDSLVLLGGRRLKLLGEFCQLLLELGHVLSDLNAPTQKVKRVQTGCTEFTRDRVQTSSHQFKQATSKDSKSQVRGWDSESSASFCSSSATCSRTWRGSNAFTQKLERVQTRSTEFTRDRLRTSSYQLKRAPSNSSNGFILLGGRRLELL